MKTYCSLIAAFLVSFFSTTKAEEIYKELGPETNDVWFSSYYNKYQGVNDYRLQAGGWGDSYRFLIRFDVSNLPKNPDLVALMFYCYDRGDSSTTVPMNFWRITSSWNEYTGWNSMPSATGLGYFPAPTENRWYALDITKWYNEWKNGTYYNWGLMFGPRAIDNKFNNFYSSDYWNTAYRPRLYIRYTQEETQSLFKLGFPLAGYSPYTTRIVATFDNDRTSGTIRTYNGEIGNREAGEYYYTSSVVGYKKVGGGSFNVPFLSYDDEIYTDTLKNGYIFYDNHSGYDFAPSGINGMPIYATGDGVLIIASNRTTKDGFTPWRNSAYQLPGNVNQWDTYHAFCILHADTYSSWYLHCRDLAPNIKNEIIANGFAKVTKGQLISYAGEKGSEGAPHLHFGVRKGETLIDPYGSGTRSSVLWEISPP